MYSNKLTILHKFQLLVEGGGYRASFMYLWPPEKTAIGSIDVHDLECDQECLRTDGHWKIYFSENVLAGPVKGFDQKGASPQRDLSVA